MVYYSLFIAYACRLQHWTPSVVYKGDVCKIYRKSQIF